MVKTAVIVCHDSVFGPPHELRDYFLKNGVETLLFIGHRNMYAKDNPVKTSYYCLYGKGKEIKSGKFPETDWPEYPGYIRDFILTLFWSLTLIGPKIDLYIGLGNLNAFAGLILKFLGLAEQTVYYVIDYIPDRFPNRLVNRIYHFLDRICCGFSTVTWNYSESMITAREKYHLRKFPRQIVVPNGVHIRDGLFSKKKSVHDIVYLGTLFPRQGIQLVIEVLPELVKKYPDLKFKIIGQGPYRPELEKVISKYGVAANVRLMGFIADPIKADRIIAGSALAVAMYRPNRNFVRHTEPGKVKRYLAYGVPVVMTDISPLAHEIVKNRCGFICRYDAGDLAGIISAYLKNPARFRQYPKNAVRFAGKFRWDNIFTNALKESGIND